MLRALTLLACSLVTGVAWRSHKYRRLRIGVGFCVRSPDYGLRKNSSGTAQALASAQEQLSGLFSRKSGTAAGEMPHLRKSLYT